MEFAGNKMVIGGWGAVQGGDPAGQTVRSVIGTWLSEKDGAETGVRGADLEVGIARSAWLGDAMGTRKNIRLTFSRLEFTIIEVGLSNESGTRQ